MFLLNNLSNRDHKKLYPRSEGKTSAVFDISQQQIESKTNRDWHELSQGDLICVVGKTGNMSTLYRVDSIENSGVDEGRGGGTRHCCS